MNKKIGKNIIKICLFITLANLPFITIIQQVGIDVFLDSFEYPNYYQYLKDTPLSEDSYLSNEDYVLIQKSTHPEFTINEGDIILYYDYGDEGSEGRLYCNKIYHTNLNYPTKKYYTVGHNNNLNTKPVYEYNIIGKVVGIIGDNIWNSLSIAVWGTSINNLNIRALFTDH